MLLLDITFIWPESYSPCRPVSCTTHRKKKSSLFRLFKNHGPEKWFSSWWLFPFISSLTRWTSSSEAWSLEADPNLRVPCAVTNSSKSYNHGFWSFQRWATGLLDTVGLDYNTRLVHPSKNVKKSQWKHTCQRPVENQNNSTNYIQSIQISVFITRDKLQIHQVNPWWHRFPTRMVLARCLVRFGTFISKLQLQDLGCWSKHAFTTFTGVGSNSFPTVGHVQTKEVPLECISYDVFDVYNWYECNDILEREREINLLGIVKYCPWFMKISNHILQALVESLWFLSGKRVYYPWSLLAISLLHSQLPAVISRKSVPLLSTSWSCV